jgi:hypothetical protein
MLEEKLQRLERAIFKRSPLLSAKLRRGLATSELEVILKKAKIAAVPEAIKRLYLWRNGTTLDQALMTSKTGFFPGQLYQFSEVTKAIEHMRAYSDSMCSSFPELAHFRGRFFPAFWNGSTNWIGFDPQSKDCRVVLVRYFVREASIMDGKYTPEIHDKTPPREAYKSFEDFLTDAIRANSENAPMLCFQEK